MADGPAAERDVLGFDGLLRRLRDRAGLTQDELAEAAAVSQRAISDLERGINATARKDTAVLLAGALGLDGPAREVFARTDELARWGVLAPPLARVQTGLLGAAVTEVMLDGDDLAAEVLAHRPAGSGPGALAAPVTTPGGVLRP